MPFETVASPLPALAVGTSLAGALLIVLTGERRRNLREAWTLLAAVAQLGFVAAMLPRVVDGAIPQATLLEISPGISVTLRADPAGMVFALLAAFLWTGTSVFSIGYMRGLGERKQTRYFAAFALSLSATMGVAFAANLLTFVLFYELLTLFTYPLVVHRETDEAVRAGRKYLAYALSGGLALIAATAWLQLLGVDASFTAGGFLSSLTSSTQLWGLFALLMFGVGVKAAVMPFHSWLPTAMVAPTPVSALLHAVAVVKAGVFGVLRVGAFVFGIDLLREMGAWQVITIMAAVTLLTASVLALRHDNLKRRLAYSTISHLSYIVLGVMLLAPVALTGALLHIVGHGVTKITLFFCAGAIDVRTHKERVSELDGIGRQMPVTMTAFALASLSMAGIPPFVLFTSKWFLGQGASSVGQQAFLLVYLAGGVLSAAYLLPIVYRAFWRRSTEFTRFGEAPMAMVVPLVVTAALALVWGVVPDFPFRFFELADAVGSAVSANSAGTAVSGGGP